MNLQNIETFVEVATHLSFAAAGRRLRLPSSTVTSRIQSLEDELGVRLLHRTTRHVALTPEGEDFLERCSRAMAEIKEAAELVSPALAAEGTVRISIPTAFPKPRFAQIIGAFQTRFPRIYVQIRVEDQPVSFVRDGVDLALRGRAPGGDDLIARLLTETPVIFVAPLGRLRDEGLPVLRPVGPVQLPDAKNHPIETRSLEMTLALTVAGYARSYLPETICTEALNAGAIETGQGPEGDGEKIRLYLVYHGKRHIPQRVRLFIDFLVFELGRDKPPI